MKRLLVSVLLIALSAGSAFAQSGAICIYSDVNGAQCDFTDTSAELMKFYVFHTQAPGATAVQFAAPIPPCMNGALFIADELAFPVSLGTSQDGISVGYGGCLSSPVLILTMNVLSNGLTSADCGYPVVADPSMTQIRMVDCASNNLVASGGLAYINSSLPCECDAAAVAPVLQVTPGVVNFGSALISANLTVANIGGGSLVWSAGASEPWLSVSPAAGTGGGVVTVVVDRTGLAPGSYADNIVFSSNGGQVTVPVVMSVVADSPVLLVEPTTFNLGTSINAGAFNVTNAGAGALSWLLNESIPWLTAFPTSGGNSSVVNFSVDRTGLVAGSYMGLITISSNGGTETVTVNMDVPQPVPVLGFSPASLSFPIGVDQLPLDIFNSGAATLNWNISSTAAWLSVNPASGTDDQQVLVTVDRSGLPDGTHSAMLNITSNGGNNNVPVQVTVSTVPILSVVPSLLVFTQTTTLRFFEIRNVGVGTLQWATTADEPWIEIQPPTTGTGPASVWVQVNLSLLPPGQQTGHVEVFSNGGNATVTVRFNPPVSTFPGYISIRGDQFGNQCEIYDQVPGLLSIYVVHTNTTGATASQWMAPMPNCMVGATYLADQPVFGVNLGNSQTGIGIGYGQCLTGPIHILTMLFFGAGLSSSCCRYDVYADPSVASGQIEVVDCNATLQITTGSPGFLNPNQNCACGLLPVEETTWGRVKSLYAPRD
jgi:hypothetical protein